MKRILATLTLICLLWGTAYTQLEIYYTWEARIQLNGELKGKALILQSQKVNIRLDYETTEMILRFPVNSLIANNDTVNQMLKNNLSEVVFKGALSLDFINTNSHPPQTFIIKGDLILDDSRTTVQGSGELHHINDEGMLSSMLGFIMHLNLKELNIQKPWPEMEDEFEVVVKQALLKNEKL